MLLCVDELDRAIDRHKRARKAEKEALAALHDAIRNNLTTRSEERGAQADVARRTGYTRERLRQLMNEGQ